MFEIDGVPEDVAREAFRLAAAKLPVKTPFRSAYRRIRQARRDVSHEGE
jgi:ribosomal protein L16/L10AE